MLRQRLSSRMTHRKNIQHHLFEESRPSLFLVHRLEGLSGPDDFVEMKPPGNDLFAGVEDQPTHEARLSRHEEGRALRWEGVACRLVLHQKIQPDQDVRNGRETASRRASGGLELVCT